MTATGKRLFSDLLAAVLGLDVLGWISVFTYANWLRFSCPSLPDPATGHIVFIKAVRGVYYATPTQAWWAQGVLLPIGITAVGAFLLRNWANDGAAPRGPVATWAVRLASPVFVVTIIGLLIFGDYILAFLTTGQMSLPVQR